MNALIGYTGFVGSTLLRQTQFDELYNSSNIEAIRHRVFDSVVCAGVPAQKWIANKEPEADWIKLSKLLAVLAEVQTKHFVLISTVDVYFDSVEKYEDSPLSFEVGQPYGLHRLRFEKSVSDMFPETTIIRLPALFGKGMKKNVIYDLLNTNCLDAINSESHFQWYDMECLWRDITTAIASSVKVVNFVTEPIPTSTIIQRWFNMLEVGKAPVPAVFYDIKTRYSKIFGGTDGYIQSANQVLLAMDSFFAR